MCVSVCVYNVHVCLNPSYAHMHTHTCTHYKKTLLTEGYQTHEALAWESLEECFAFSVLWACGGFLSNDEKRSKFERWWAKVFPLPSLPKDASLWDYIVRPGGTMDHIQPCSDLVPRYSPPSSYQEQDSAPYVHTCQTVAYMYVIKLLVDRGYPVLLDGPTGSGKTSLLLRLLKSFCDSESSNVGLLHLYANGLTDAGMVWGQIKEKLEWNWGRNFTPKGSRRLVCFMDDLHIPQVSMHTYVRMYAHQTH